jgi:hypothetical protein
MIALTLSEKQIKPGVIHTDQFNNEARLIEFTIPHYTQNGVNLRDYTPYLVSSVNGVMDCTMLTRENNGVEIKLTWALSEHFLMTPGVITYQIVFANSKTDVFNDRTAAWFSYKAVIVNRITINTDDYISANYPTLMRQWMDLMHTLSGAFGTEITYMQVDKPIPVEERLPGRLYYQWLKLPTTRATCAVGTVNFGRISYADSGLYINDKHIFVDDTSDEVFVLNAAPWIDVINNADCGVTASDASNSEDIIIHLTAKNSGASENSIGLKLDVAKYGVAAGEVNPSGGKVSGSTLTGGCDQLSGLEQPTGRFEDAHGNILGYDDSLVHIDQLQTELNKKVDKTSSWGMPDYSAGVSMSKGTNVVPVDAIGVVSVPKRGGTLLKVKVNGTIVSEFLHTSNQSTDGGSYNFIIPNNSMVEIVDEYNNDNEMSAMYYPLIKE